MVELSDCFVHGSQLREGGTVLRFLLRAGHKDIAKRRWRWVVEENISAIWGIIEAGLPQQRAKSKDIAGEREIAIIAAIYLKWLAMIGGMKTLEVADDKRI